MRSPGSQASGTTPNCWSSASSAPDGPAAGGQVGGLFITLAALTVENRRAASASRYLEEGIAFCSERGFELSRLYLLPQRARLELDQGRWSEAAETATVVLRIPRTSTTPRILALGRARTRTCTSR